MKRNKPWSADLLLILLAVACVIFAVLLCVANPSYLIFAILLLLFLVVLAAFDIRYLRYILRKLLNGKGTSSAANKSGFATLAIPALVLQNDTIVWYNTAFRRVFLGGGDVVLQPVDKILPKLDLRSVEAAEGQVFSFESKRYTVYGSHVNGNSAMRMLLFTDNTTLKLQAEEYVASRPAVMYLVLDTYDEILQQMRESERTGVLAQINTVLEQYFAPSHALLCPLSSSRYLVVIEERGLKRLLDGRFTLLDTVRKLRQSDFPITLSIGVGHEGDTFEQCENMAQQALDMALGRGGDQAAVKGAEGFSFYGGVSRSVEKRTRVKSRVVCNSIRNLVEQSDRVLIMGHKQSDMDSVGAAIGMLRFCKSCGKSSTVVINQHTTMAKSLVNYLLEMGYGDDLMSPEAALALAGPKTLLIVVDTHMKYLLESEAVYNACENVVVIDHHRKMVGHIDNAVVFYHEPYASSASELVSELLQYNAENLYEKPTSAEAEALLAGIMLDTRTFSLHVGVRTFEAAAFLRRVGAETATVKKMFASSMEDYVSRSLLVSEAEVYEGCAIVVSEETPEDVELVVAQAANDLLTIEGVKASFVAVKQDDIIRVSARSLGEVNVQVVLEKLGGGGHLTMAGAQIKDATLEQVRAYLMTAISQYHSEAAKNNEPVG